MDEENIFGIIDLDDDDTSVFDMTASSEGIEPVDVFGSDTNTDNEVSVFGDDKETPENKNKNTEKEIEDQDVPDLFKDTVEEETKEEDESVDNEQVEDDNEVNPFSTFAEDLISVGVYAPLEEGEELPTDAESLKEFAERQKIKGADQYLREFLSKRGPEYMDAFTAIFVKGVRPEEYYSTLAKNSDILQLDLEKEENQEKVVRQLYQEVKGVTGNKLDRLINGMKEDGDLHEEALAAQEYYQDRKKQELRAKEQEKEQEELRRTQIRQHFNHTATSFIQDRLSAKEVDGVVLSESLANSVARQLTAGAYRLPSGEVITEMEKFVMDLTNPENIEIAVKLAILREHNFDFRKIKIRDKQEEKKKDGLFSSLMKSDSRRKDSLKSKPNIDNFTSNLK